MLIMAFALTAALFLSAPLHGQANFGSATVVAGNDVLIGQPANFYGPGAVYVFRSDGGDNWREAARLSRD